VRLTAISPGKVRQTANPVKRKMMKITGLKKKVSENPVKKPGQGA
jgi:hypothetical protein